MYEALAKTRPKLTPEKFFFCFSKQDLINEIVSRNLTVSLFKHKQIVKKTFLLSFKIEARLEKVYLQIGRKSIIKQNLNFLNKQ